MNTVDQKCDSSNPVGLDWNAPNHLPSEAVAVTLLLESDGELVYNGHF